MIQRGYVHTCINGFCPIPRDISVETCAISCSDSRWCAFFKHNNLDKVSTCFLHGYNYHHKNESDICRTKIGEICCRKGKYKVLAFQWSTRNSYYMTICLV